MFLNKSKIHVNHFRLHMIFYDNCFYAVFSVMQYLYITNIRRSLFPLKHKDSNILIFSKMFKEKKKNNPFVGKKSSIKVGQNTFSNK